MRLFKILFGVRTSSKELIELLENGAIVVDVRTPGEFKEEHAENSINISLESPVSGFISEKFSITDKHYGIDIVLKEETPVKSVADGIVLLSEWTINSGYTVAVYHKNKLMTVYKHNKSSKVSQGDFVQSGQIIALSGNTGELTTGPHLHFELWKNGTPINPEPLLNFQ